MADSTTERLQLAQMVRELERQLRETTKTAFTPAFAHPDHVRHYFEAYQDYLITAMGYPELPQRELLEKRAKTSLPIHRDNLASISGRIGELAAALEASARNFLGEVDDARRENEQLKETVRTLTETVETQKALLEKPRSLGGGRVP